jgi:hypothetical protein
MTTYDFEQVKEYANNLSAALKVCEEGEALYCYNLDNTLKCAADNYFKFANEIRKWAADVFFGRVAFDPASEQLWKAELVNFYGRANRLLSNGSAAIDEHGCDTLDGSTKLKIALWNMAQLLNPWITPSLAVGPSARQPYTTDAATIEADKQKLALLPKLPVDWEPYGVQQSRMFQKIKNG